MRKVFGVLISLVALTWLGLSSVLADEPAKAAEPAKKAVKAVYHLSDGNEQATNALRNIKNHLKADPTAKITVVGHSKGIDFMLDGAADKDGNPYEVAIQELAGKGVSFEICNNTLVSRKIDPKTVAPEAKVVPSGVAEIANLQANEGFVYVKP